MKRTSYFDLLSKASAEQSLLMAAESNRLFADCPRKATHEFALPVQALVNYVMLPENEFLRIYIGRMLDGANQIHPINIKTPEDFFQQLDNALTALPQYDANFMAALPFYTILQPFMSNNYGFYFFTNEGVRPFFRDILQAYHDFLESPESRQYLNKSYGNWLSEDACKYLKMHEYVYDPDAEYGGFLSWNEFFIRQFYNIDVSRPLAADDNGKVIISPVDGQVWTISKQVQQQAQFEIKGEQYYLTDLLAEPADSPLLTPFIDGLAVQVVLMPFNYHRWHAPVTGEVTAIKRVEGLFFAQPAPDQDYAKSFPFLSHINTRAIIYIQADDPSIGQIALIFVGLTEVSSCQPTITVGSRVERGEEIGHFAFGGSTCCMLFERAKIASLDITDTASDTEGPDANGLYNIVQVRQKIAEAL